MSYKGSYVEELTKELTQIELEYVNYGRWDDYESDDEIAIQNIIRAPKYCSRNDDKSNLYDIQLNAISQHALNEITLYSDDIVMRMIKRLEQLDKHIDDAWKVYFKHWELFSNGKFSALDFQWKFFHFFNIPIIQTAGIMENPDFPNGKTTDDFFWDLHDAMMYKQGAVKWILWHLKEQLGIAHQTDEQKPDTTKYPSPDSSKSTQDIELLRNKLFENKFFELKKVIDFKNDNRILAVINESSTSIKIATLQHFGFIDLFSGTQRQIASKIASIVGRDSNNVRNEIASLMTNSSVDRSKYKAGNILKEIPYILADVN